MNNYDPTDIVGQQRSDAEAAARKRTLRETEIADLKWLMSSPRGRRLAWRELGFCRIYTDGFDRNAMEMARVAGMRAVGLWLLSELQAASPEMIPVMEEENRKKEQQDGKRDGRGEQSK